MTKVTSGIFNTIFSGKAARFAGGWLTGAAESRSARRRLNAILRLACRTLGLKRGKSLGMLGVAVALAIGLSSPVLAQTASPVTVASPAVGTPGSPAGLVSLTNGFGFVDDATGTYLEFTLKKGVIVRSPNGPVKLGGVDVPLNVPIEKDYFSPTAKAIIPAGTFFDGPVTMLPSKTGYTLRFPAGTVFPVGTTFYAGVPAGVTPGIPTTKEVIVPPPAGIGQYAIGFPAVEKIPAGPETRFTQMKINTDKDSKPATTSTDIAGDIALGSGATATGAKDAKGAAKPATAVGDNVKATGAGSTAIGGSAEAIDGGAAFGYGAKASHKDSVALGGGSITEDLHSVDANVILNGKQYPIGNTGATGVVSVGNTTQKRQIINVAPGKVSAGSTDGVNGSQLNAAYEGINDLGNVVKDQGDRLKTAEGTLKDQGDRLKTAEGTLKDQGDRLKTAEGTLKGQGDRLETAEGTLKNQGDRLKTAEGTLKDQGDRLEAAEGTLKNQGADIDTAKQNIADQAAKLKLTDDAVAKQIESIATLKQELNSGSTGLVQQAPSSDELAIGGSSAATTLNVGGQKPVLDVNGQPVLDASGKPLMEKIDRNVTGVADAVKPNDAVNKKQLDEVGDTVKKQGGEIDTLKKTALLYDDMSYTAAHGGKDSRIRNLEAGVSGKDAVNKDQLDAVDNVVKQQGADIDTAKKDIADQTAKLKLTDESVAKQGADIEASKKDIAKQGADIDTAKKDIADQAVKQKLTDDAVAKQGETLKGHGDQIDTAKKDIADQAVKQKQTDENVASQGETLKGQDKRLTNTENTVAEQVKTVKEQAVAMEAAKKNITEQSNKLTTLDTSMKNYDEKLTQVLDTTNPNGVVAKTEVVATKLSDLEQKAVTYGTAAGGTKTNEIALQGGDANAPVLIKNVAEGKEDQDAANVGQVKKVSKEAKDYTNVMAVAAVNVSREYSDASLTRLNLSTNKAISDLDRKVDQGFNKLSSEIGSVRKEAHQAAAVGLAASSLRFDNTPGKVSVAMGGAVWRDQGAMAIGAGYTSESGKVRANLTGATSGGEVGVSAGISFTLN